MTVRVGRPTDELAIRRLQQSLDAPSPSLLAHALAGDGVLVDCVGGPDGPVVGYLLAVGGDDVHIAELVVDPEHRREGRATRLLTRLLDGTSGRITLYVAADNAGARRLYEAFGFEQVERRQGFYDDGTDALLFARDPPSGQADDER